LTEGALLATDFSPDRYQYPHRQNNAGGMILLGRKRNAQNEF